MFSLPSLIKSQDGSTQFNDGVLIKLPIELRDGYRVKKYGQITSEGWSVSEFGYSAFSFRLPLGQLVIFPGLYVRNITRPTKKFHGYTANIDRDAVERIARETVNLLRGEIEAVQGDLGMLVHDLRALSNSIYNPAVEAQRLIERQETTEAAVRIENVIAAQGILKMRTDALDFSGNPIDQHDNSEIKIYRKIDKVQRCFKSLAKSQGKSVTLSGNSFRKIRGQDVFELVPYTLIDNAVKYSPTGYDISVDVMDQGDETTLTVKSYGPRIELEEKTSIFARYVRGRAALKTKNPGSGIGLNIASKIVDEVFGGSIIVKQADQFIEMDGLRFYETDFIVSVPSFS